MISSVALFLTQIQAGGRLNSLYSFCSIGCLDPRCTSGQFGCSERGRSEEDAEEVSSASGRSAAGSQKCSAVADARRLKLRQES